MLWYKVFDGHFLKLSDYWNFVLKISHETISKTV
jgi:hypothetical protein